MWKFMPNLLFEEQKDGGTSGYASGDESKGKQNSPTVDSKPEAQGSEHDDFGYETPTQESGDKKPEGTSGKDNAAKKDDEKIENPATGYGEEPPVVKDEPKPEPQKEQKPLSEELGFEVKTEGLPPEELGKLKDFIKSNELSQKAAQAFIDLRRNEIAKSEADRIEQEKQFEKRKQEIKSEWHKELKNDPDFGGEKFGFHVMRAEKVLEQFMPNTKKELTSRKSMLPPYVMRDLAKLAETLFSTEKLTQGEPSKPSQDDDDPLSYYQ